jgi:hypothetical protein
MQTRTRTTMKTTPKAPTRFEAFPQIDPGTHHGVITQLVVTPDRKRLLSAGETTVRVWNTAERQLERLLLGRVTGATDDGAVEGFAGAMTTSRDGRHTLLLKPWHCAAHEPDAAAGHDAGQVTEVQVFDLATGNLHGRFVHPGQLFDIATSPDGRWLVLLGNRRVGRRRQAELQLLAMRDVMRTGARPAPTPAAVLALGPARVAASVPAALAYVPGPPKRGGAPSMLVVAVADPAPGRGVPADLVAWVRHAGAAGLELVSTVDVGECIAPQTLSASATRVVVGMAPGRGRMKRGRMHWFGHDGQRGAIDLAAPPASTAFSPSGHRLAVGLMVDMLGAEEARTGEQTVQVDAYDVPPTGGPVLRSSYFGHDHTVRGLVFIDDDTVASAGGDNQAIHFWRPARRIAESIGAIRGVGRVAIEPGVTADERVLFGTVPRRLLPPGNTLRQQSFDLRRMALHTCDASLLRATDYRSRKWWVGYPDDMVIPLWFIGDEDPRTMDDPTQRQPDLSLFVGADDSWVIWTRSGYYDAGGPSDSQATRRIAYRINRGPAQEALLIPADRFKHFYQPHIVRAVVRQGSEQRARARGVVVPPVDVAAILPPIAELARGGLRVEGASARLAFSVHAPCPGLLPTRASLLRNGRVVWTERQPPQRPKARYTLPPVPLLPGSNRFEFHVENAQAKSVPVAFEIEGPQAGGVSADAHRPGRLFLLSVGVAEFADPDTQPLLFAARDAQSVLEAFAQGRVGRVGRAPRATGRNAAFRSVDARLLVNAQATKAAILAEVDRMTAAIRERHQRSGAERDVLFVFFSGHGVRVFEKGMPNLFLQNHDLVPTAAEVDATGLSILDLGDRITSVPAEVVLIVDACHAGLAGRGAMQGLDAEELARRVHAIYERGMYLLSAARAEELAHEDDAGRSGVLTASLLLALAGRQDRTGPVEVLMADLVAGVQRLVPEVSARAGTDTQTPVCRIYGDMVPLPIFKA